MLNPCLKCQSLGKCAGTCWVLDMAKQSERIDREMETPEYKAILEGTVPQIRLLRMGRTDQEMYWAEKAIGEIF